MTELEKMKNHIIQDLKHLCSRCKEGVEHICPIQGVTREIEAIRGIPVKVNDKLFHVVFYSSLSFPT